jgi:hypothetical protein
MKRFTQKLLQLHSERSSTSIGGQINDHTSSEQPGRKNDTGLLWYRVFGQWQWGGL